MPKPFMLGVEIEEVALGKVLRTLNGMPGVVALHMDFTGKTKPNGGAAAANGHDGDRPRRGRPPGQPRKVFPITGIDEMLGLFKKKKKLSAQGMRDAFAAAGRSPGSTASILHGLLTTGVLARSGIGEYALTKKGRDKVRYLKSPPKKDATKASTAPASE